MRFYCFNILIIFFCFSPVKKSLGQNSNLKIIDQEKLFINPIQTIKDGEFIKINEDYDKGEFYVGVGKYFLGDYAGALSHLYKIENKSWYIAAAYFKTAILQSQLFLNFSEDYINDYYSYDPLFFSQLQLNQDKLNNPNRDFSLETINYQKKTPNDSFLYLESLTDLDNYVSDQNIIELERISSGDFGVYYQSKANYLLSKYHFRNKNFSQAIYYGNLTNESATSLRNNNILLKNYELLAHIYLLQDNSEELKTLSLPIKALRNSSLNEKEKVNETIYYYMNLRSAFFYKKKINLLNWVIYIHFIVLGSLYFLLRKKVKQLKILQLERFHSKALEIINSQNVEKKRNIPKPTEHKILYELNKFEANKKFLDKEITLKRLSEEFGTNTRYLSDIIFNYRGFSFKHYINNLRIRYLLDEFSNKPTFLKYKIDVLANEAGFSSTKSFINAFKKYTGNTPFNYINSLENANKKS